MLTYWSNNCPYMCEGSGWLFSLVYILCFKDKIVFKICPQKSHFYSCPANTSPLSKITPPFFKVGISLSTVYIYKSNVDKFLFSLFLTQCGLYSALPHSSSPLTNTPLWGNSMVYLTTTLLMALGMFLVFSPNCHSFSFTLSFSFIHTLTCEPLWTPLFASLYLAQSCHSTDSIPAILRKMN